VSFKIITNIKIFGLKDLVNFASASGMERLISSHLEQVSTHTHAKFSSISREFYKNRDKFGWINIGG